MYSVVCVYVVPYVVGSMCVVPLPMLGGGTLYKEGAYMVMKSYKLGDVHSDLMITIHLLLATKGDSTLINAGDEQTMVICNPHWQGDGKQFMVAVFNDEGSQVDRFNVIA